MADIDKLQGTAIANLAKAWGTTTANLSKIMGLNVNLFSGTVSSGTAVEFNAASTTTMDVCMMDSTHAIVFYVDAANNNYGTACCLSLSGTTITAGADCVIASDMSYSEGKVSICMMDSTHALVGYSDGANSYYGTVCALILSGTTITTGYSVVVRTNNTASMTLCRLTDTYAVCAFYDTIGGAYIARGLTYSGGNLTVVGVVSLGSTSGTYYSLTGMDSTHAILAYKTASNTGGCMCLTYTGTTITKGSAVVFDSNTTFHNYFDICTMDSTHAIVAYVVASTGTVNKCCCLTLSGTTITAGTPVTFTASAATFPYPSICSLDSTHAVITYSAITTGYLTALCVTLSGTTITAGSDYTLNATNTADTAITTMDSTHAIAAYRNAGSSDKGTTAGLLIA